MKKIHVSISIQSTLDNKRFFGFENEDGSKTSKKDIKLFLKEQLKLGREVLPIGEPCEGFCYKNGCPGHEK